MEPSLNRSLDSVKQELLALRCGRGERAAFEELIRTWEDRLFYFIRRYVDRREDAYDLLQQTWLKVVRNIRSLKEPGRLAPWLYRIARNTCLNHGRVRSEYVAAPLEDSADHAADRPDGTRRFGRAEEVHYGLGRISLPHREVLTLFFLQDVTLAEIARIVGVSEGTVKSRLHHAKAALRRALEAKGAARHE